jgi:hypothetical protein
MIVPVAAAGAAVAAPGAAVGGVGDVEDDTAAGAARHRYTRPTFVHTTPFAAASPTCDFLQAAPDLGALCAPTGGVDATRKAAAARATGIDAFAQRDNDEFCIS